MADIKAILFDADGVIQDASPSRDTDIAKLFGSTNSSELFESIWEAEEPCLSGHGCFKESVKKLLTQHRLADAYMRFFELWHDIEPDEGIIELIRELKTEYMVCLATNQEKSRGEYMAKELKFDEIFDHSFYSYQLSIAKPSKAYFHMILERLGIKGYEVVFIDDNSNNVEAAIQAGLNAEIFHISEGKPKLANRLKNYGIA